MIEPEIRTVLDGTPLAHLATVLPDGSPHTVPLWIGTHGDQVVVFTGPTSRKYRNLQRDPRVAISIAPAGGDLSTQVILRGRVAEWVDGDAGWEIVDGVAQKYTGAPYPRGQERVAALIDVEQQKTGLG